MAKQMKRFKKTAVALGLTATPRVFAVPILEVDDVHDIHIDEELGVGSGCYLSSGHRGNLDVDGCSQEQQIASWERGLGMSQLGMAA